MEGYCVVASSRNEEELGAAGPVVVVPSSEPRLQLVNPSAIACSRRPFAQRWTVVGGVAKPGSWSFSAPETLQIAPGPTSNTSWDLQLSAEESGTYPLTIHVEANGQSLSSEVTVEIHSTPRIVAEQLLADVCPNERINLPLASWAEGGRAADYQWSVRTAFPGSDSTNLGLSLESGTTITGLFTSPVPAEEVTATVFIELTDGVCDAEPRQFALRQRIQGQEFCPQVQVRRDFIVQPLRDQLPAACLNEPYEVQLEARQFLDQPLEWREIEQAPGLALDPVTHRLAGTARGQGALAVQVTDNTQARPRVIEQRFPLATRNRCWLAYLTGQEGQLRLELLDGILRDQASAHRTVAELPASASVEDFQFSPHGNLLAYRLVHTDGRLTIRLLDLHNWQDVSLEGIDGSVSHYAWSTPAPGANDSDKLAIAYVNAEGEGRLGGVNLSAVGSQEETLQDALAIDRRNYLEPTAATILSALHWFGDDRLVFDTPDPLFPAPALQYATVSANSEMLLDPNFSVLVLSSGPIRFLPNSSGYFVAATSNLFYFPKDSDDFSLHRAETAISPSGNLLGRSLGTSLELFEPRASSNLASEQPLFQSDEGCSTLSAWSADGRQIACTVTVDGLDQWTFFRDISPVTAPARQPTFLGGTDQTAGAPLPGLQRTFSNDGQLFAFRSQDTVYVANAATPSYAVRFTHQQPLRDSVGTALSFSPDAQWLAAQRNTTLELLDTATGNRHETVSVTAPSPCSETFYHPELPWCGVATSNAISWSPQSDLLMLSAPGGDLLLLEVDGAQLIVPDGPSLIERECSGKCALASSRRFQPN